MSVVYTLWLREMKRFIRARSRIIGSLAMPFFWLAFVGIGFSSAFQGGGPGGVNYIDFLTPGILAMTLLFSSVFSGISVIWDRQFGFLKEILVAPVNRLSIMTGKVLGGATTAIINGLIMLAIAILVLNVKILGLTGFGLALIFMFLISVAFVSLGLAIASSMRDPQGFQLIINFLVLPMFFLSGALFPLSSAPTWMQAISYMNPMTYGVDGMRGALIGISHFSMMVDFIVLAGFSIVFTYIGARLFRRVEV